MTLSAEDNYHLSDLRTILCRDLYGLSLVALQALRSKHQLASARCSALVLAALRVGAPPELTRNLLECHDIASQNLLRVEVVLAAKKNS